MDDMPVVYPTAIINDTHMAAHMSYSVICEAFLWGPDCDA